MQDSEEFMSEQAFTDMMHGQVHPVILSSEHLGWDQTHGGLAQLSCWSMEANSSS